jgi:multimeric flavodoxin WrbA
MKAKKFKILGINSSPRKKSRPAQQDSSTRLLLEHALKSISSKAGIEIIDLIDLELHPSEGCYSTDENLNQTPVSIIMMISKIYSLINSRMPMESYFLLLLTG